MIKQVIFNIQLSDLPEQEKKDLIYYAENLYFKQCPVIFDNQHLMKLFELQDHDLKRFMTENMNHYSIKKRNGDLREVWKPNYKLKTIQKWILKNILNEIKVSECAHGFVKSKSILTNAETHQHKEQFWVFSMDIKDFFPSIKYHEVKRIFMGIGYSNEVSEALSLLTTVHGKLAQGFPTSPMLSNLFFRDIDEEFQQIASRYHIRYSRYADDITFSGVQKKGYLVLSEKLKQIVTSVLSKHNFIVNEAKTRLMKGKHPKIITGLVVTSQGVRIPQKYIRRLNKEIYYCRKFGVNGHLKYQGLITIANYKGYLIGLARFIYMVDPVKGAKFIKMIKDLDWD
ncbi:reverse transcriptase family protein [Paenibacillus sp. PK1-4R]|uniref:reverse transcriptase family protein n=1 Tax=Paenibacillus sp. PK1-4R TaxID=3049075 RepID=UPI0025A27452|nr:reverse transcriptase family protein [Paenibacillus sp. PK1-4R]WJM08368.1 reverse transcriptase family protein [Paenibacillus sp. PK1-4R]